jgi:hypothetical protein
VDIKSENAEWNSDFGIKPITPICVCPLAYVRAEFEGPNKINRGTAGVKVHIFPIVSPKSRKEDEALNITGYKTFFSAFSAPLR